MSTREKIQKWQGVIKKMSPEELRKLADSLVCLPTIEGRTLSIRNTILCYMQKGGGVKPSIVGGFKQWLKAGRCVNKGEEGLAILFPAKFKAEDKDGEEIEATKYYCGVVFDISQTVELPSQAAA